MKVLKSRNGFTLIEVILAMSIAALSLTSLFVIQGNMVTQSARMAVYWNALIDLKNFFWEQEQKVIKPDEKDIRHEKKIGITSLTYQTRALGDRSAYKNIKNLRLIMEQARWSFFGFDNSLDFVGVRLVPEEMPKEEEKGKS
jgi:prepilin-type N-terminal cleavage/methylation domain-containing protein